MVLASWLCLTERGREERRWSQGLVQGLVQGGAKKKVLAGEELEVECSGETRIEILCKQIMQWVIPFVECVCMYACMCVCVT